MRTAQHHHSPESFSKNRYKVSPHRAQICKQEVAYPGFQLKQGTRSLVADRKQPTAALKIPENQRQLRGFLGITELCRIWIPNLGLITKPLYNSLKGLDSESFEWTGDCQVAFDTLKEKLISAPALGLPDLLPVPCLSNRVFTKGRELDWGY